MIVLILDIRDKAYMLESWKPESDGDMYRISWKTHREYEGAIADAFAQMGAEPESILIDRTDPFKLRISNWGDK